eukprot:4221-Heterococcus_DN1.PRE.1
MPAAQPLNCSATAATAATAADCCCWTTGKRGYYSPLQHEMRIANALAAPKCAAAAAAAAAAAH